MRGRSYVAFTLFLATCVATSAAETPRPTVESLQAENADLKMQIAGRDAAIAVLQKQRNDAQDQVALVAKQLAEQAEKEKRFPK